MTVLTCIGGVDGNHFTRDAFSLQREDRTEHGSGSIGNRLGEAVVLDHAFDVEFLNSDHAEPVRLPAGGLMNKVMPSIANSLMDARQNLVGFTPFAASLLGLGLLPACFCQRFSSLSDEAVTRDAFSCLRGVISGQRGCSAAGDAAGGV